MSLNITENDLVLRYGRKLLPVYDRSCGWCNT